MKFTFKYIEKQYIGILSAGYQVITCQEYCKIKHCLPDKVIVNRVDIDFSIKKAARLLEIFNRLNIKATFFLRLHAPEYNPFAFENYSVIRRIVESGHELGYHSEVIDQAAIWNEDPEKCLLRDLKVMEAAFDVKIYGVASHGGMTGLNNLDFWKNRKASDYGLLYEAYDKEDSFNLFQESFYISDSEWTRWKCYDKGNLVPGDVRSPSEHLADNHNLLHLLIHPDTYYDRHIYE